MGNRLYKTHRLAFIVFMSSILVLIGCRAEQVFTTQDESVQRDILLYEDDFTNSFDWDTQAQGTVRIGVEDGAYRMRSDSTAYVRGFNTRSYDNIIIQVDVLQVTDHENNAYGVMCRASPGDTSSAGYYFLIGADGSYSIRVGRGGEVEPLVNWARTNTVNQRAGRNVIRVVCVDDYLALYINNEFVVDVRDDRFRNGFVGFALATSAGSTSEVAFDNVRIWSANVVE